ncbi:amidohydrolase 2 [Xylogone sp. PMI_703]|nr:amidohydrolase 2 [Xylogone sp. PMI_703]
MSVPRTSNGTLKVNRTQGKIAIEEAVGSPCWPANQTYPPKPQLIGLKDELPFNTEYYNDCQDRLNDVGKRLKSMDNAGISYAVVSLTSPGIQGILDPNIAVDFARKTNDDTYQRYVKAYPDRFGFFACVAIQKPEEAAAELERAVKVLGAKGVLINGFTNLSEDMDNIRYLDDPACEPFWAKLAELNVPLYLHPRNPPMSQQRVYQNYPILAHACMGFSVETAGHVLRIMCSGILDRYPNIKIILGHCAEGLSFYIHRIDHKMITAPPGITGPHKKTMMEYLQQNFYATMAGIRRESTVRNTIEEMGENKVLYSVDYPFDSNEVSADWFDSLHLNANTRRNIASENAKALLNLP